MLSRRQESASDRAHHYRELAQRIYGIALRYENLNDHEQLCKDPASGILEDREELDAPLAGKSTLNHVEMGVGASDRYKITFWKDAVDELLMKVFIESHQDDPAEIFLDVDTTDLPLHGK